MDGSTVTVNYEQWFEDPSVLRLSRRERKKLRRNRKDSGAPPVNNYQLRNVIPKTKTQQSVFESYRQGDHLMLTGMAGTGKTYVSIFLALQSILQYNEYKKLIVVRSIVPTRDMGFLPGTQKEKQRVYEGPYNDIFADLFGKADAYDHFKNLGVVDFLSTSFVRGITLNDAIVIVDESQNLDFGELDSVITRIGNNCRIIFCGDFRQSDLERQREKSGLQDFLRIIQTVPDFKTIEFGCDDIVRSALVKRYIIAKLQNGVYV